jgi:hypothetical protein
MIVPSLTAAENCMQHWRPACTPQIDKYHLPCAAGYGHVWLFRRQRQGPDHPACAAVGRCSTHCVSHKVSACSVSEQCIAAAAAAMAFGVAHNMAREISCKWLLE